MIIYYAPCNNGDGSASVHFFESQRCIDLLEEHDLEAYGGCEGGGYFEVEGNIIGLNIQTEADVMEHLVNFMGISEDFING